MMRPGPKIVQAVVVRSKDSNLAETDVVNFCRGKLANLKIPRRVEFIDKLPRTASGKVLKRQLRQTDASTC